MPNEHQSQAANRAQRIEAILRRDFAPLHIVISDDSSRHAGHAGARPEGETHYTVLVVSEAFAGLSRVARHRAVNAAMSGEFSTGLHALALILRTPAEHAAAP